MTEADARLKLATSGWFWRMGCSTLLRVRLSTYEPKPRGRVVELTDLDVLGIEIARDFALSYRTAECKSGKAGARELFWLRGVADFFGADQAYLVLDDERFRTRAVRDLSAQLNLGVLTGSDFKQLLETYGGGRQNAVRILFDQATIDGADKQLSGLNKKLDKLVDYNQRLFWQIPKHRNLQLGVAYLEHSKSVLDTRQPAHLGLLLDHLYRYCLALFDACGSVLKRGAPAVAEHLPAYLHGGEAGLREATRRIEAAEQLQKQIEGGSRLDLAGVFSPVPPYYRDLLELVTRLLRRPQHGTAVLRHLQAARCGTVIKDVRVSDVLGDEYDAIAVKLINDVTAFLAKAADLKDGAREHVGAALDHGEPDSTAGDSETESAPSRPSSGEQQELGVE